MESHNLPRLGLSLVNRHMRFLVLGKELDRSQNQLDLQGHVTHMKPGPRSLDGNVSDGIFPCLAKSECAVYAVMIKLHFKARYGGTHLQSQYPGS